MFYDVTTLYFDSEVQTEGALCRKGFSKDGKIGKIQILFCMLIDKDKRPIGYRIFKGNTGIDLSILVRNPDKLNRTTGEINTIKGDVLNADDVMKAVINVNTVIWTIGGHDKIRRKKGDTNVNLCETGTRNMIEAAKLNGAERIICISSWGVADSYSRIPFFLNGSYSL